MSAHSRHDRSGSADVHPPPRNLFAGQRQSSAHPQSQAGAPPRFTHADAQLTGEQVGGVAGPLPPRDRRVADLFPGPPCDLARQHHTTRIGETGESFPRLGLLEQLPVAHHRRTAGHADEGLPLLRELLDHLHAHIVTPPSDTT